MTLPNTRILVADCLFDHLASDHSEFRQFFLGILKVDSDACKIAVDDHGLIFERWEGRSELFGSLINVVKNSLWECGFVRVDLKQEIIKKEEILPESWVLLANDSDEVSHLAVKRKSGYRELSRGVSFVLQDSDEVQELVRKHKSMKESKVEQTINIQGNVTAEVFNLNGDFVKNGELTSEGVSELEKRLLAIEAELEKVSGEQDASTTSKVEALKEQIADVRSSSQAGEPGSWKVSAQGLKEAAEALKDIFPAVFSIAQNLVTNLL